MSLRLFLSFALLAFVLPFDVAAETELNTSNSVTVNEAPVIAPQPVEPQQVVPVEVSPEPPKPLPVHPQPVALAPRPVEVPDKSPFAPSDSKSAEKPQTVVTAPATGDKPADSADEKKPLAFADDETPQNSNAVVLQGLNKVTGRISKIDSPLGVTQHFGNLEITPKRCWKSSPEDRPEDAVLIEIREAKIGESSKRIFLGWMFSSSPGLSGLEHPVYDVNVVACEYHADIPKKDTAATPAAPITDAKAATAKNSKPAKKSAAKAKKKPNP